MSDETPAAEETPHDENDIRLQPSPLALLLRQHDAVAALHALQETERLARLDLSNAHHTGLCAAARRLLSQLRVDIRIASAANRHAIVMQRVATEAKCAAALLAATNPFPPRRRQTRKPTKSPFPKSAEDPSCVAGRRSVVNYARHLRTDLDTARARVAALAAHTLRRDLAARRRAEQLATKAHPQTPQRRNRPILKKDSPRTKASVAERAAKARRWRQSETKAKADATREAMATQRVAFQTQMETVHDAAERIRRGDAAKAVADKKGREGPLRPIKAAEYTQLCGARASLSLSLAPLRGTNGAEVDTHSEESIVQEFLQYRHTPPARWR